MNLTDGAMSILWNKGWTIGDISAVLHLPKWKVEEYIEKVRKENKYSLLACGKSIFYGEDIINFPYSYGSGIGIDRLSCSIVLKDSASIEELKTYLSKNKDKILKDVIEQYEMVKTEYLDVIKTYSLDDFRQFETFREFGILTENQKERVREGYLLFSKKKELVYADGDFNRVEEFYDQNKEKFNFRILMINGERFY